MEKTNKSNLVTAIIEVMKAVKGIEKSANIGTGTNAYKGVSDQEVKQIIGKAMTDNGLCILPIETNATVRVDRWDEVDSYSKETPKPMKAKQQVFTEVETKYMLMHVGGESQIISGYGHGVDTQDKSAGKATTYALKNALLYMFMVPTGKIDDSDKTHSDDLAIPNNTSKEPVFVSTTHDLPWLNENTDAFLSACEHLKAGTVTISQIEKKYKLSAAIKTKLQKSF